LQKRARGSWTAWIELGADPETGKRRRQTFTVKGTKREAEEALTRALSALDAGTYVQPGKLTVGEYLDTWLQDSARPNVAAKTFQTYADFVRIHLKPGLGAHRLTALQPLHVQQFLGEKLARGRADGTGGLAPRTVLHHFRVLSEALRHAVRLGLLAANPCDRVNPPSQQRRAPAVVDEDGAAALLEAADGSWLYVPILLAIGTGMRRGEILALRWSDLDMGRGIARVQQSLEETRQGLAFKEPKSAAGRRAVALGSLLVEALREHQQEQRRTREALGAPWQANDLVVCHLDGSPRSPDGLTLAFRRLARRADCHLTFHGLRHCHASHLLKAGVNPRVVSERLGHSSVRLTLDTYSHVLPGLQEDAAARTDAALRGAIGRRRRAHLRVA